MQLDKFTKERLIKGSRVLITRMAEGHYLSIPAKEQRVLIEVK